MHGSVEPYSLPIWGLGKNPQTTGTPTSASTHSFKILCHCTPTNTSCLPVCRTSNSTNFSRPYGSEAKNTPKPKPTSPKSFPQRQAQHCNDARITRPSTTPTLQVSRYLSLIILSCLRIQTMQYPPFLCTSIISCHEISSSHCIHLSTAWASKTCF